MLATWPRQRRRTACPRAGPRRKQGAAGRTQLRMLLSARLELRLSPGGLSCDLKFDEGSAAIEAGTPHLAAGEVSRRRVVCFWRIAARRLHGISLMFIDLLAPAAAADAAGGGSDARSTPSLAQVVIEGASLCGVAAGLALRLGSTVAVTGRCGHTRRGAFSLFASDMRLVGLPPEPAAASRAAQVGCPLPPLALRPCRPAAAARWPNRRQPRTRALRRSPAGC